LRQGFLAFRPIKIRHDWTIWISRCTTARRPTAAANPALLRHRRAGEVLGKPARLLLPEIPLDFTGWKSFRLERGDFTPYGGPIGWLDAQLVAVGLHVSRAPSRLTEVHLADVRLGRSLVALSAERDLQRTGGKPLIYRLTAQNREAASRRLTVRLHEESYAYGTHIAPFDLRVSRKTIVLPPQGSVSFTLTASPMLTQLPAMRRPAWS